MATVFHPAVREERKVDPSCYGYICTMMADSAKGRRGRQVREGREVIEWAKGSSEGKEEKKRR